MKKRIFGLIMSLVLVISSISVLAGQDYGVFGSGADTAEAFLYANGGSIYATTTPLNGGQGSTTGVRALGKHANGYWVYGGSRADTVPSAADVCIGAESYHNSAGFYTYLDCAYN